jgi:hypothetical protein
VDYRIELRRQFPQSLQRFGQIIAAHESECSVERRKLLGGNSDKVAQGAGADAPAFWQFAGIGLLHLRKHTLDGISHALGCAPADAIFAFDVGKRESLRVAAHVERDAKQSLELFEAHPQFPISDRGCDGMSGVAHRLSQGGFERIEVLVHLFIFFVYTAVAPLVPMLPQPHAT